MSNIRLLLTLLAHAGFWTAFCALTSSLPARANGSFQVIQKPGNVLGFQFNDNNSTVDFLPNGKSTIGNSSGLTDPDVNNKKYIFPYAAFNGLSGGSVS